MIMLRGYLLLLDIYKTFLLFTPVILKRKIERLDLGFFFFCVLTPPLHTFRFELIYYTYSP